MPNFILFLFSAEFHCKSVLVPARGLRVATVIVLSCYGTVTPHLLKIIPPNFIILLYSAKLHCKSVCTGAGTWCYFSYKKLCTTFFCFHIPYDMVYGIPTVPTRAREKSIHISHGLCTFLPFFLFADTIASPTAKYMLPFWVGKAMKCGKLNWLYDIVYGLFANSTGGGLDVIFCIKDSVCLFSVFIYHIWYGIWNIYCFNTCKEAVTPLLSWFVYIPAILCDCRHKHIPNCRAHATFLSW